VVALDDVSFELAAGDPGTLLTGGSGALTGTLAGVPLLGAIQNLIDQVGGLSSSDQAVRSGAAWRRRPDPELSQRPPAAVITTRREERSCIS
jgi:hypothetical protein